MFRKACFIFCFVTLTLSAQWAYSQGVSTPPAPSPSIPLADAKPVTPAQDEWEFDLIPYFWMAGLKGDVTLKGNDAKVDMSFGDIWDGLKFGAQTHFEAKKGKWGIFLDATYMKLSTDIEGSRRRVGPGGVIEVDTLLDAEMSMEEWLIEFGGAYQIAKTPIVQDKNGMMYLDLLVGGRYWYLSTDVDVDLIREGNVNVVARSFSADGSKQWIDPFIGLRTRIQLTKNLMLVLRGDVGGFSVGSKFSWNASGYLGYSVSEMISLWAGYRALGVDYHDGSGSSKFVYDVIMQGPSLGISFRF